MIELALEPAELAAIVTAMDRWPMAETPPDGWWTLQDKLRQAIAAKPDVAAAINEKLNAR